MYGIASYAAALERVWWMEGRRGICGVRFTYHYWEGIGGVSVYGCGVGSRYASRLSGGRACMLPTGVTVTD